MNEMDQKAGESLDKSNSERVKHLVSERNSSQADQNFGITIYFATPTVQI